MMLGMLVLMAVWGAAAAAQAETEVTYFVKHRAENIQKLHTAFHASSDPESHAWGSFLSHQQVSNFAPMLAQAAGMALRDGASLDWEREFTSHLKRLNTL